MATRWTVHLTDAELSLTFDDQASAWERAEEKSHLYNGEFSTSYLCTVITDVEKQTATVVDWRADLEAQMRADREAWRRFDQDRRAVYYGSR